MRRQARARASSGAYAFTLAASLGRGNGSVLTQWLTRNSGADVGPRFGRHVAASRAGSVSAAALLNAYGVSSVIALYAGWYQGAAPAWFSASSTSRWSSRIMSRRVGQVPLVGPR